MKNYLAAAFVLLASSAGFAQTKTLSDYSGQYDGAVCVMSDAGTLSPFFVRLTFNGSTVTMDTVDEGNNVRNGDTAFASVNVYGGLTATFNHNGRTLKFGIAFDDKTPDKLIGTASMIFADGHDDTELVSLRKTYGGTIAGYAQAHPDVCSE